MSVTVYGASDDLIEVDGDVREEFSPDDADEPTYLGFSDGTAIRIVYDADGAWRITVLVDGSTWGPMGLVQAPVNDEQNYSDRLTIASTIKWVVCGNGFKAAKP